MKYYFFFIVLLILPVNAFAQEAIPSDQIDYDRCEYVKFNSNIYAPFYVHINHDPAIAQTFKSRHDDNPSVTPFQRAPEGVEPGQATWFEFGAVQNATATYQFELDLEYATVSEKPRMIVMQLYQAGSNLMMEKKLYLESTNPCLAMLIHADPPPHIFTPDEVISIANQQVVSTTKVYGDRIEANTNQLEGIKNWMVVLGLVVIGVSATHTINNRNLKRGIALQKEEYELRNRILTTAIQKQQANNEWLELNVNTLRLGIDKMRESMVGTFGDMLGKVEKIMTGTKEDVKSLIDDMRKELDIAEHRQAELKISSMADLENMDFSTNEAVPEEVIAEPIEKSFGFDIQSLVKEPFTKIFKRNKPDDSKPEDFTAECKKIPNDKLVEMNTKYTTLANEEIKEGKGYTDNYDRAEIIHKELNSRLTDIEPEAEKEDKKS